MLGDPQIRSLPPIYSPGKFGESALSILENALDRIEAIRSARGEIARAESEIQGLADEGLTWRVTQSARARQQADHPSVSDDSDLGEDSGSLAKTLAEALQNEIWRKPGRR